MKINEFAPDTKIFEKMGNLDIKNKEINDLNKDNKDNTVGFGDMLKQKLNEVNSNQITADETTKSFVQGDETDVHKVMLDTEEAKMSLELAVQVRNKLVEAYQELSRTQL